MVLPTLTAAPTAVVVVTAQKHDGGKIIAGKKLSINRSDQFL